VGEADFDAAAGHRFFSADSLNKTWDLLDKVDRTPEDDEQMLLRAAASLWHWTQRTDATAENLSVGFWLMSRVHAVAGCAEEAVRYGKLSLSQAGKEGVASYALAYAHEALARSDAVAGRRKQASDHVALARKALDRIVDPEARNMLVADLATVPV
jgi:hypothetical protein